MVAPDGEYAGGGPMSLSAGGGRLVGVVELALLRFLENPMSLVVDVVCLIELNDAVLDDTDLGFVLDSLVEPNFRKKEGIFAVFG